MQINLAGFLEKDAPKFMTELWTLLLEYVAYFFFHSCLPPLTRFSSAQKNPSGVPTEIVERKKEELRRKKEEADRVKAALEKRREAAPAAPAPSASTDVKKEEDRKRSRSPASE
jgi:hypothetical protein